MRKMQKHTYQTLVYVKHKKQFCSCENSAYCRVKTTELSSIIM